MSTLKFNPESPADLKRVLPALRMMVRYPTKTTNVVSVETCVELSELREVIRVHGRPTAKRLAEIEEKIEDGIEAHTFTGFAVAEKIGGKARPAPVRELAAPPVTIAATVVAPAAAPAAAGVVPHRPWLKRRAWIGIVRQYLPAIEAWVADATLPQSEVCRRVGVRIGTFSAWKIATFGAVVGYGHRPPEAEMRAWLEWARVRVAATNAASGREFGPPPAPRANAIAAPEPVFAKVAPVRTLADLAGKERRHLVASVVCGLLAGRRADAKSMTPGEWVTTAYDVVAEIVRQDAAHSAPNGGAS